MTSTGEPFSWSTGGGGGGWVSSGFVIVGGKEGQIMENSNTLIEGGGEGGRSFLFWALSTPKGSEERAHPGWKATLRELKKDENRRRTVLTQGGGTVAADREEVPHIFYY